MHYGWRRRSEIPHRRYWISLIVPLFAVALIVSGVIWELGYENADGANIDKVPPAPPPGVEHASSMGAGDAVNMAGVQLYASRHEAANLQQELNDVNLQVQQGHDAFIAANEKVQTLETELAAATQNLAEAKADHEEALRVAGKMWEDWRRLRQDLATVCEALDPGKNPSTPNPNAAALEAACRDAKPQ